MTVEVDIKQKMVRTAELEADADRVRRVKQAEGEAQVVVLNAKAQADAMQHTLPLKQKQIEQTRLESEAKKEPLRGRGARTSQSDRQPRRVGKAQADGGCRSQSHPGDGGRRLRTHEDGSGGIEAEPALIQKIIAERLSDKVQVMMVPSDGNFSSPMTC